MPQMRRGRYERGWTFLAFGRHGQAEMHLWRERDAGVAFCQVKTYMKEFLNQNYDQERAFYGEKDIYVHDCTEIRQHGNRNDCKRHRNSANHRDPF